MTPQNEAQDPGYFEDLKRRINSIEEQLRYADLSMSDETKRELERAKTELEAKLAQLSQSSKQE